MATTPDPLITASSPDLTARPLWIDAAWVLVFGVIYAALFVFAISLPFRAGEAAGIWPADGLAVGVLMRVRFRLWPAYCVMILVANAVGGYLCGFTFGISGFTGMNVMQPLLAAWLLRRYADLPRQFETVRGVMLFALVSLAVTALSSAMGASDPGLSGGQSFGHQFNALLISDFLGIVIVAPLILAWSRESRKHLASMLASREIEAAAVCSGLILSTHFVFGMSPDSRGFVAPMQHLTMPFLIWIALRFGLRGSTVAIAAYALMTLWYTANGTGPFTFAGEEAHANVLALQLYMGMIGVVLLIGAALMTERRNAFADSESWRSRFEAAIEASGSLVFEIHAASGQIDWAGDTRNVLGLGVHELNTTRLWTSRVHPDDRERLLGIRRRLADGTLTTLTLEYRVRRGDNTYGLLEVNAYSVVAPASELSLDRSRDRRIIGFVKDVTESRLAEEERRRLEAELRQAQKMEAIGRLAGGIAHDFNNILTSILGYGEMARNRAASQRDSDAALVRQIDTILKAGERGRSLVSQILTFSRKNPGQVQILDLDEVLDEVVTLVRGSNPHEILYRLEPMEEPPAVCGNATELHQLFMNLAVNGLQAMPGKGTLEIVAGRVDLARSMTVLQGQLPAGPYLRVNVTDHGVGIDASTRLHMFEPFFTTKSTGQGTGLGLSLAMSVAKGHGGGIDVESTPGGVTTFSVYLPAAGGKTAASLAGVEELPRGNDASVLLVDDEPELRRLAEEILAGLGYQTASYDTSVEALAAFEREPDRFDAVVTDEVMPGLTGTQLAMRIHARKPGMPIIIITGYGGPGFELRAQQAGVMAVLKKPYQRQELADTLAKVLGRPTRHV